MNRNFPTPFHQQGFQVLPPPCILPDTFGRLLEESKVQRRRAWLCEKIHPKPGETKQRAYRSELGPLAHALLKAPSFLQSIFHLSGYQVRPSLSASCYTYYESPDDFLDIHFDREEECALTFLLYLDMFYPPHAGPGDGLKLFLYRSLGEDRFIPIYTVTPAPNSGVLLRGSAIPHGRRHLQENEGISLLAICFAIEPYESHRSSSTF